MEGAWTLCARCGEPHRNHLFGLCEGGGATFLSLADASRVKETIVAAAVQIPTADGRLMTISLPPPARHHDIMHPVFDLIGRAVRGDEQGFLTSSGHFADRLSAMAIALQAGQLDPSNRKSGSSSSHLFSEDLW